MCLKLLWKKFLNEGLLDYIKIFIYGYRVVESLLVFFEIIVHPKITQGKQAALRITESPRPCTVIL